MKFQLRYFFRISFLITVAFNAYLLFASCNNQSANTKTNFDSSSETPLNDRIHFDDTVLIAQGKSLFTANCSACHAVFKTDNHLEGIIQRIGVTYFKIYLTKQDSLVKAKDKYALELKQSYGNMGNSHNFKFSDEQLNAIIAFLIKYSS